MGIRWWLPGGSVVKNPPANPRAKGDTGLIHESRISPAGGNGNPLQYPCWQNPMDRGAWWATVHEIAKSQTRLGTVVRYLSANISLKVRPKTAYYVTVQSLTSTCFLLPLTLSSHSLSLLFALILNIKNVENKLR